jgi:hypothetical protein
MIEIACWKAMNDLLKENKTNKSLRGDECKEEDFRELRNIILSKGGSKGNLNDVAFRIGDIYAKVVEVCLRGDFGAEGGTELLNSFQHRVIHELQRCVI